MEQHKGKPSEHCGSGAKHRYGSVYDWTLVGFAAAAGIVFLLGNGVVFWNRKRRYFQSKGGAWLILGGSFGGLMWILSAFVVNGHFHRHGLLGRCILWTFWLQGTFGVAIWFSAIILRLHNIWLLSNRNPRNRILFPLYLAISWVLLAVFSIFATRSSGHFFEPCEHGCKLKPAPKVLAWVTMVAPYFIGTVWLLVRLQHESREQPILADECSYTFEYLVMTGIITILTWVTFLSESHRKVSGRCFLTFCVCCLVFCYFWVKLGWPIYLCVFKPDEMDSLDAELASSAAGSLEALEAAYRQRSMHVPSSEGAALERVTRAAEELETYKARIRELEAKKAELLRLLELRQRRSSTMEMEKPNDQ